MIDWKENGIFSLENYVYIFILLKSHVILGKLTILSVLPCLSCVLSGKVPNVSVLLLKSCEILGKLPDLSVPPGLI